MPRGRRRRPPHPVSSGLSRRPIRFWRSPPPTHRGATTGRSQRHPSATHTNPVATAELRKGGPPGEGDTLRHFLRQLQDGSCQFVGIVAVIVSLRKQITLHGTAPEFPQRLIVHRDGAGVVGGIARRRIRYQGSGV